MGENSNNNTILTLTSLFTSEKIEYTYLGEFNDAITEGIIGLAEAMASENINNVKLRKRFYFILVEGLQNITRHQEKNEELSDKEFKSLLIIQRVNDTYVVTTGNPIKSENIPYLKQKLQKINSLDKNQLKDYYREILTNKKFSEKGGAGLGLIEIARKSGNKLNYDFEDLHSGYSFFYMQTVISLEPSTIKTSFDKIKFLHKFLSQNNITLGFSGIFTHDKLINVLSILENNQKLNVNKNKIFSIIIEMMQNIVKHADEIKIGDQKGKFGVFYIAEKKDGLSLVAGNYIKNEKVEKFKAFLDKINSLNYRDLSKLHFQTLLNYKEEKETYHGLGLIDMRLKSRNKLRYLFHKFNDQFSFFHLEVSILNDNKKREEFFLKATPSTPEILLSEKTGKFYFIGKCFPQNAEKFFEPVIKWLEKYAENPNLFTIFVFQLKYFNTPTQQQLVKIMKVIEKIAENSAVIVKWYYEAGNEDSLMFGIEFSQLFNIQFDLIEVDKIETEQ